jgi:hypothetical protein
MATLRNLAIAIFKLAGHTNIAAACRHHARDATRTLATLGLGPAGSRPVPAVSAGRAWRRCLPRSRHGSANEGRRAVHLRIRWGGAGGRRACGSGEAARTHFREKRGVVGAALVFRLRHRHASRAATAATPTITRRRSRARGAARSRRPGSAGSPCRLLLGAPGCRAAWWAAARARRVTDAGLAPIERQEWGRSRGFPGTVPV